MEFKEADSFSNLPQDKIKAVCAFCYYAGKFILVKNHGNWEPVAGHVEINESSENTLIREVKEESNTRVIDKYPLGYFYSTEGDFYSTLYLCFVEPDGPFISDPGGEVTEIKFVDFSEIPEYVNKDDITNQTLSRCEHIFKKIDKSN
jgi:ADP-ribose pyrophosphatase YjhB (NUDIX family)